MCLYVTYFHAHKLYYRGRHELKGLRLWCTTRLVLACLQKRGYYFNSKPQRRNGDLNKNTCSKYCFKKLSASQVKIANGNQCDGAVHGKSCSSLGMLKCSAKIDICICVTNGIKQDEQFEFGHLIKPWWVNHHYHPRVTPQTYFNISMI